MAMGDPTRRAYKNGLKKRLEERMETGEQIVSRYYAAMDQYTTVESTDKRMEKIKAMRGKWDKHMTLARQEQPK